MKKLRLGYWFFQICLLAFLIYLLVLKHEHNQVLTSKNIRTVTVLDLREYEWFRFSDAKYYKSALLGNDTLKLITGRRGHNGNLRVGKKTKAFIDFKNKKCYPISHKNSRYSIIVIIGLIILFFIYHLDEYAKRIPRKKYNHRK